MPPFVIIASLYPLGPLRVTGSFLKSIRSLFLSSFDISLTFLSGSMPDQKTQLSPESFLQAKACLSILKLLVFASSNSLRILLSKASCVSRFKSTITCQRLLIGFACQCTRRQNHRAADPRKCVKSISQNPHKASFCHYIWK